MRALKSKKTFISRDSQESPSEIDVKERKMVLIGGGITVRQSYSDEDSFLQSPTRVNERAVSRSAVRYHLRPNKTPIINVSKGSFTDNDCRPW
jgi:hypothetical protein